MILIAILMNRAETRFESESTGCGVPVRVFVMAKDMIALFGLKPFDDIDIVFTGMQPGEKLFEELNIKGENLTKTRHPKIFIGTINTHDGRVVGALTKFEELGKLGRERELRAFLMSSFLRRGSRSEGGFRISNFEFVGARRTPG